MALVSVTHRALGRTVDVPEAHLPALRRRGWELAGATPTNSEPEEVASAAFDDSPESEEDDR